MVVVSAESALFLFAELSSVIIIQGRNSGMFQVYSLPLLSLECKQPIECRPEQLALNSTST